MPCTDSPLFANPFAVISFVRCSIASVFIAMSLCFSPGWIYACIAPTGWMDRCMPFGELQCKQNKSASFRIVCTNTPPLPHCFFAFPQCIIIIIVSVQLHAWCRPRCSHSQLVPRLLVVFVVSLCSVSNVIALFL